MRAVLVLLLVCLAWSCAESKQSDDGAKDPCEEGFAHVDFICGKHLVCISETEYEEYETIPCWEVPGVDPECCEGGECHFVGTASCPDGHTCVPSSNWETEDQCLPCDACEPDCTDKECGSDGCGGHCGLCDTGALFCEDGKCVAGDPPDCAGKMCGPDSVGGSCGSCPEAWECGLEYRCVPLDGGCGEIPEQGVCVNGWQVTCAAGEPQYESCPYGACIVQPESGAAACAEVPCLPDCFGKACGDDGCGGSCGECPSARTCEGGACVDKDDACNEFDPARCSGYKLVSCDVEAGVWTVTPCLDEGLICEGLGCGGLPGCRPVWPDTFSCDDLPEAGTCAGDHYFYCEGGFLAVEHCKSSGPYVCGRVGLTEMGCKLDW